MSITSELREGEPLRIGNYRWVICALLFFVTTVNYIDRFVLSVLGPQLSQTLGWTKVGYGNISIAFQIAYAIGLLFAGRIIDRIGVRRGFTIAVALWSITAMAHGFIALIPPAATVHLDPSQPLGRLLITLYDATSQGVLVIPMTLVAFIGARLVLGIAESGNFPACIKSVGEWFPKKERALVTGIFNSGSNIGILMTPIIMIGVYKFFPSSWSAVFFVTGALGFIWVIFWLRSYTAPEKHPRLTPEEFAYIRSDSTDKGGTEPPKTPWIQLLGHRQTWAFTVGKLLTDPIWYMLLTWIPMFMNDHFKLNITGTSDNMALPLIVIYLIASVGSIGGGWISSSLVRRGWTTNHSRKTAMLICALCVVPIFVAAMTPNVWVATLLIGLAAAAHQGWSANLFTLVSDTTPRPAISSVTGIGGMAGSGMSVILTIYISHHLQATMNNYLIPFLIASVAYVVALGIIHLLVPRLEPMKEA